MLTDEIGWNNSNLSLLQRCGEAFRRKVIERERVPGTLRMKRGTAVHAVACTTHKRQLDAKAEQQPATREELRRTLQLAVPTAEEARDLAADEFEREWATGVSLLPEERSDPRAAAGAAKDFAVAVAGHYVQVVAPEMNPVGVERRITVKPQDSQLTIHGTMDLITQDIDTGEEDIDDTKTSEKSPPRGIAETSQQLTMYAMLRWAETGALPRRLTLHYMVRTPKREQLRHVPLHTTRSMDDVRALVHRLDRAVEAVKRGVFLPTDPGNWWCSPRWCEFYTTCPYVNAKARPAEEDAA